MKQANHILSKQWILGLIVVFAVFCFGSGNVFAQELTNKEAKNVQQVKSQITKAGLQFKEKKFKASAKLIANVQRIGSIRRKMLTANISSSLKPSTNGWLQRTKCLSTRIRNSMKLWRCLLVKRRAKQPSLLKALAS